MQLISISDTHYGISTDSGNVDDPISGINRRTQDGFQALDQVVNYAIENDVKVLIHSGDVFDNKTPSQNVINAFAERLKKLSDAGIHSYILLGNHDASQRLVRKTGLDLMKTLDVPNVCVTRGGDILDLGWVQIASISYWYLPNEISAAVDEVASRIDWNRPAILVVHLQIEFAEFPGSFKEDLPFVPLTALTRHKWAYVQAGHIHRAQILNQEPFVFYAGSLTRHSFAEEKDPKTFWLSEINDNNVVLPKQIPVECLRMLTLKGTMEDIRAALKKAKPENFVNVIVRVIVNTEKEDIDEKFFKTMFAQAFKSRISKEAKTKELKKMDANGLSSMKEYAESYFAKEPRKVELMALLEEIRKTEESKAAE